jgi:DNA-binding YbaB/EbfC family protein
MNLAPIPAGSEVGSSGMPGVLGTTITSLAGRTLEDRDHMTCSRLKGSTSGPTRIMFLQQEMLKMQEELATRTVESTAGGGVVKVVASGKNELVSIEIKPEAVDPEDVEMLQDLVLAAVNEALKKAQEMINGEMARLTGGLKIPGMF